MSHDTSESVGDWTALIEATTPRSPQVSCRGDLAYVTTRGGTGATRVRILSRDDSSSGNLDIGGTGGGSSDHLPRWSGSGDELAFVSAGSDVDELCVVSPSAGPERTTVTFGAQWRVEDLAWIDDVCLAALVADRSVETAVAQGSVRPRRERGRRSGLPRDVAGGC